MFTYNCIYICSKRFLFKRNVSIIFVSQYLLYMYMYASSPEVRRGEEKDCYHCLPKICQIYLSYITCTLYIMELGTDHLTWRGEGGVMVFCFVPIFFFRTTQELEYFFFLSRKVQFFFPETLIRLFFFSSTKIRISFSATLGIRIFF